MAAENGGGEQRVVAQFGEECRAPSATLGGEGAPQVRG
jgi:hypothetical protein